MSLMSAAPLQDETIRGRLFVALNRSEEHTPELQSLRHLVCHFPLEKKTWYNAIGRCIFVLLFALHLQIDHRRILSFPTRRSSDLKSPRMKEIGCGGWI